MAIMEALIDAGPLDAYYNKGDKWHISAQHFFETFKGRLISTEAVATEVMWLLGSDWRVQNEFLNDLETGLYQIISLTSIDYKYVAEINEKYKGLPGDFADLSIVALAQRLKIKDVVGLEAEFDIYRKYGNKPYNQLFPKWDRGKRSVKP